MIFATLVGLLYWRYAKPEMASPVATPIALPISMLVYVALLIALTVKRQFWDSVVGIAIVASGFPVYHLFLARQGEGEEEKVDEDKVGEEEGKGRKESGDERGKRKGKPRIDGGKRQISATIALQKLLGVVEQEPEGERKRN